MARAGPTRLREPRLPGVADDYAGPVVARVFTCLLNGNFGATDIQTAAPHTPLDCVKPHVSPLGSDLFVIFRTFC